MKLQVVALMLSVGLAAPAFAETKSAEATEQAAVPAAMTSAATPIGEILDNPAAKAVVEKYLPGFSSHPQIDMARGFTLKAVQGFEPAITDEILAKIDADLAALATAKPS